ncbi:MAG: NUDIX hydrolase [Micrococcales bacterium]|nr:NUDIX hydrolase [Micrococcales bacterium]NBR60304.1 NUDIX hydrolase [Actinomycetota bacterium]NBR54369.1 NUDIX hydrolase [Micrococcales bacterium]NBT46203.1 NUDIX hydrolase [Actinomycetota bacterium]NBY43838.1 NUDIX hydrolase [Micrococcales bacterium]
MEKHPDNSDLQGLPSEAVISSEIVFKGKIWDVIKKTFNFHGKTLAREFIEHPGAVAVLAVDDQDQVLVIRQFRMPVNEYLLEIPAGLLDIKGESSLAAAKRELAEETDHQAANWELLQVFHTSPGSSSETIHIFLATGITQLAEKFLRQDEEAQMQLTKVPFSDLLAAVRDSKVKSPTLVVAVLALAAKRKF